MPLIDHGFCMVTVYPKVKVIQKDDDDDSPESLGIYLKDFQSPSLYDHPSNSPEQRAGYAPPYVRVHVDVEPDAGISVKAGKVKRKVAEEKKSNNKASSVLPPRAVLSSPENDAMHGIKIKNKTGSGLKNHNLYRNAHVKCKESYEFEKRRPSWK